MNVETWLAWEKVRVGISVDLWQQENAPGLLGLASLVPGYTSLPFGLSSLYLTNRKARLKEMMRMHQKIKPKSRTAYEYERTVTVRESLDKDKFVSKRITEGRCPEFVEVKPDLE